MKKVAIIGAGAAGLCTARHLLSISEGMCIQAVLFEQRNTVGGTWIYEETDQKKDVLSSIYKNLKTNLPKQVMNFPDFPFPEDSPSYLHHTEVRKYLEDYAKHFDLFQHIRFQTKVVSVDPLPVSGEGDWCRWLIEYQQLDCHLEKEEFDAVVVCNGHYSTPCYPDIPGLEHYKNKKLHSHFYRDPEDYKGTKKALILGFGPSGRDIGLELAEVCDKVYVCHKGGRCKSKLPDNTVELTNVSHVTESGNFITQSGDSIEGIELLIICTGYLVTFPFFTERVRLKMKNDRIIENLYKHLFCIDQPSLSIVGIPWKVAPFPLMHQQSAYIASVVSEIQSLPSREEMIADNEADKKRRSEAGKPERYLHMLGNDQFQYSDMLASLSGHEKNPKIIENLYRFGEVYRSQHLTKYKTMEFKKFDDAEFEVIRSV